MYVFNCNNLLIGKWDYVEEYLLVIVWVTLGGTVTAVIFCVCYVLLEITVSINV